MNHRFLFPLFILLFFSTGICAQDDDVSIHTVCYSYTYEQDGALMKMITEEDGHSYTTNYTYEGNDIALKMTGDDGKLLAVTNEHHDSTGHLLSSQLIVYNDGITDTTWTFCNWNSNGMLVHDSVVDSKKGLRQVSRFVYNDTTLLEELIYYPSMQDTFITRYSFDAAGRRLRVNNFNKKGPTTVSMYGYNKDGSLRYIKEYEDFGQQTINPYNVIQLEYSHGKLVRRHSGDKNPEDAIDYYDETFTYDKSDRLIRMCVKSLD